MNSSVKEMLLVALDALPQAVLLVGRDGAVLWRNAAARTLRPDESQISHLIRVGEDGEHTLRGVSVTGADGRRLTLDVSVRPLVEAGGEDSPLLIVATDVSGRVSMERRLATSERMAASGKLAARVAHELNNPLDGVLRYVGLAERLAGEDARRHLASARSGLRRIAQVIRELRDEGEGDSGAGRRQGVSELLAEAIVAMQPRADALGAAIVCEMDNSETATPSGMFQVFCNVIRNSLDAMSDGGLLKIRLASGDDRCVVEFSDNGCGIPPGSEERIFEPFYTTKGGGGMGLGLAISREITERIGGTISASCGENGGAVMTVRLPATPTHRQEQ